MLAETEDTSDCRPAVSGRSAGRDPYTRAVGTVDQRRPSAPGPDFWFRALTPLAALVLAFIVAGVLTVPLVLTRIGEDGLVTVAQFLGGLFILLFGLFLLGNLPGLDRRRALAAKGARLLASIGVGLAVGIVLIIGSGIIIALGLAADPGLEEGLEEAALEFEPVAWQTTLLVVSVVVLAPLGEELLFRALLLRALVRRMPFWSAAAASSLLFALAHPDAYLLWPRLVALAATGLVLAWIYRLRGYWASVTAHATVNSVAAIAVGLS